jgi:hypothetical protein
MYWQKEQLPMTKTESILTTALLEIIKRRQEGPAMRTDREENRNSLMKCQKVRDDLQKLRNLPADLEKPSPPLCYLGFGECCPEKCTVLVVLNEG